MKFFIVLFVSATFALSVNGQDIREMDKTMSLGSKSAFVITHPQATDKMVEMAWEEHMKKNGKAKKNRKSKEFETLATQINMVSAGEINIFFAVEEGVEESTSYIFFDDGTKFINSSNDPNTTDGIYEFLTPFVYGVEKLVIENDLKNEENTLKSLGKDLVKLEKGNESLHSDIEKWKEKIRQAEMDIEENLQNQTTKKEEITNQESVISAVKDKLNAVGKN